MQRLPIAENIFCHTHKQFHRMLLSQWLVIQMAVTRADFARTSVTDPSVTRESNSIPTQFLPSAPKEVFT